MEYQPVGAEFVLDEDAQSAVLWHEGASDRQQTGNHTTDRPKSVFPVLEGRPHELAIGGCVR